MVTEGLNVLRFAGMYGIFNNVLHVCWKNRNQPRALQQAEALEQFRIHAEVISNLKYVRESIYGQE